MINQIMLLYHESINILLFKIWLKDEKIDEFLINNMINQID